MSTSTAALNPPADSVTWPTEHRTMNTIIHAAFRRDLRRLGEVLERFPADSRARADQITAAWNNISFQLHVHHQDEEHLFWPAFLELGVDPGLVAELESEHGQMVDALSGAESAMATFSTNPSAINVAVAHAAVAELARVLHDHLTHEERDLEPFGAEHDDTRQHKAAVAQARKSHTEGAGTFFAWLADTDDPAIAAGLRRQVPRPVLFLLTTLGGRSYKRCSAAAWD
jgi:hypothetical protein